MPARASSTGGVRPGTTRASTMSPGRSTSPIFFGGAVPTDELYFRAQVTAEKGMTPFAPPRSSVACLSSTAVTSTA